MFFMITSMILYFDVILSLSVSYTLYVRLSHVLKHHVMLCCYTTVRNAGIVSAISINQSIRDLYNVWIENWQISSLVYHMYRTKRDTPNEKKLKKKTVEQSRVRKGSPGGWGKFKVGRIWGKGEFWVKRVDGDSTGATDATRWIRWWRS